MSLTPFDGSSWQTFASLSLPGLKHGFSWRSLVAREELESRVPGFLQLGGFNAERAVYGEQTHGKEVAFVSELPHVTEPGKRRIPVVDGLVTMLELTPLVVRVADCGPVYFYDPVRGAIALAHSGRKGTELNITGETIRVMRERCGSNPADLIVQLGPCIRPPHYEVAFAQTILQQARDAGVKQVFDCGLCTAANLDRYYSYRAEQGQTGRMWAVIELVL
jgi:polyphenol oxidase